MAKIAWVRLQFIVKTVINTKVCMDWSVYWNVCSVCIYPDESEYECKYVFYTSQQAC